MFSRLGIYRVNVYLADRLSRAYGFRVECQIEKVIGRTWDQTDQLADQIRYRIRCSTRELAEQLAAKFAGVLPAGAVEVEFAGRS